MPHSTTARETVPPPAATVPGRAPGFWRRAATRLRLTQLRDHARAFGQPVTYLGVAMLVFLYCALTYLIVVDRKTAEYDAGTRSDNLVRVVDGSYSHIFKSLDNNLLFLGKLYRQSPETFELSAWVHDPSFKNELTSAFMICDANGRVVDSSFSKEIVGTDRSGLDGFRAHINSDADELLIGKPIILKFNGKWTIPVSRRLTAADGTFAGVVTALLDPSTLINNIGQIDLGPDGSIALVGLDSYLRTRSVNGNVDWENIGREVRLIPETLGRAFKVSTGHYWSVPGVFNNVRRMVSYRVLNGYPQIALVTIPESEVFRRADENARVYWFIAVTLTFVILIAIGFGAKREKKLVETTSAMKQAKDALKQSQERYQLVEAAVNDGIWDWNLLTDEDYFSSRWKGILGYAEDELPHTAATFFDLIHRDDKAAVSEAVQAHFEKDQPYVLDFRLRHKDGDYRWVHSRGKAIRNSENRPIRMLGTITDITERKRSEALIEESLSDLARAEAMALLGNYKYDIAAKKFKWSKGMYRIFGKSSDSFTPTETSIIELMLPEDRPILEQYRSDVMADRDVPRITLRAVRDDGQIIYVEGWSKPVYADDGSVTGMYGTLQDVTVRTRIYAALKENFSNLERAERIAHLGHIKYEIATGLYTWSEGAYRIMGKSPATYEPTLENSLDHIHVDDRPLLTKYRADVMAGIDLPPITVRANGGEGKVIQLEIWSAPLRDAKGAVTGMFGTVQDVTARKQAELAIKESHDNLARAESMTLLGHYKFDKASNKSTWSEGAYRIFGKSPDSFTPTRKAVVALFHPDDRAKLDSYRDAALTGKNPPPLTFRIIRDSGQLATVDISSTPIYAADGAITGYFGTVQDVTERLRAEMAINESRENLARAEAMALLGHTRTDRDGSYTWSAGVYRIVGKSPDSFTPTPENARELIHPDDRPAHDQYRRDAMAGIEVPRKSVRMIRDDGQIIDLEFWSVPIRDKNGAVIGKFSTLQDVTTLKRTEAIINESHTNLERAERMALLGHYKIDRGTGQLVWSNGIYRIFGLSPNSFTPTLRDALELIHPDDRHILKQIRDQAMAGLEIPHVTMRAFRSDGELIDIEYWSAPVRDATGAVTGVFGTVQDISIRKRNEESLERANQELEARVSERTVALAAEMRRREEAQMTLGQMQKMEAVGQLTAGIAHDFNNLLAVIGGSLEFVDGAAARGLTAEPELIDAALRATRRGRELVRRLLAFSRQSPLRAEATTIDQLVLDTLRLLQRTLGQGIDMVTQLDAKAAVISVDRNQLANALLNLALNARDAMPDGGQLTIATKCQPVPHAAQNSPRWPTGEEVCIVISDTGVGMTDDVRGRAFEPFFTTKPDGLGSGLGLSMVQGFVEQSGGTIDIESAPGSGTTITIRLPRIASESQADETDLVAGAPESAREKTVLLVEDDPDVRVVTAAQLRHLGYKVHAVANGMEAIDLIASPANIDITLTDIVLPGGLDGVALVKEAMRARPKMGVLCMSGYNPTEKHRKWLKVQNIAFLEKPFSSAHLAQALDAALVH